MCYRQSTGILRRYDTSLVVRKLDRRKTGISSRKIETSKLRRDQPLFARNHVLVLKGQWLTVVER